jgi:hypothetical protein
MIRSRPASILVALGLWFIVSDSLWAEIPSDIRVLKSSADGVEFVYTPAGSGPTTSPIKSRQYTRFVWANTDVEGEVGQPEIPVRNFLIVVPPQSSPHLSIARDNGQIRSNIRLRPVPTLSVDQNKVDTWTYVEDAESYSKIAPFPAQQAVISEPFLYRGYWVVRVSIYPVQYYPALNRARVLDNMQVRVDFGVTQAPSRSSMSRSDPLLRSMAINPEQLALWHVSQTAEVAPPWPSGTMVKIDIRQEGIYRITGHDLEVIGVSLNGIDPSRLRLFNNGGRELPTSANSDRPDSLIENAIYVMDVGMDGSFDADDYLLFYGRGVTGWDKMEGFFQHYIHHYTEDNIYWLQIDPIAPPGKRMGSFGIAASPNQIITTTRARLFREDEDFIYNTSSEPESGIQWYMSLFTDNQSHTYNFSLSNVDQTQPFRIRARFRQLAGGHSIQFFLNGALAYTTTSATTADFTAGGDLLHNGSNTLEIRNRLTQGATSRMYLDWFELEYSRALTPVQDEMAFESPEVDGIVRYDLTGVSEPQIFNITDPFNITMTTGSSVTDSSQSQVWRHYYAVNAGNYHSPLSMEIDQHGGDEYQDLRTDLPDGVDYIIISADEFYSTLAEYEDHRESFGQGLNTIRIRLSDIFDQFGWGLRDPTAIRDFLKYASDNWPTLPEYVLLVGDGDYDYKNRVSGPSGNWIPPHEDGTACSDDWYVYFSTSQHPEMAMGRWPVTSVEETETVIQKVIQYESEPLYGPWRHRITLVADDEYAQDGVYNAMEENHSRDTEGIAEHDLPGHFNLNKIYLIKYPVEWEAAAFGRQKPQATSDLLRSINDGTLIVNYIGHGNPHIWSHEAVFQDERDMPRIDNGNRLPFFLAATCSWGLFDDPIEQSFPEKLFVASGRGSIGTIAATRFTSSGSNETLASTFYSQLFQNPFAPQTLGAALIYAKTHGAGGSQNYYIMGDPTLIIGAPRFRTWVESTSTDTLQALSLFTINGVVLDESNNVWNDFSGVMNLTVFDKRDSVNYIFDNGNGSLFRYIRLGSPIFYGPSSISNGRFESRFVVPQDIAYGSNDGRFSLYYYGLAGGAFNDSTDGAGVRDSICFAETAADVTDSIAPAIDLMLENEFFREGDVVSQYPKVIGRVSDSSGVNLTGGVGHTLRLVLDGNTSWDVTKNFEYDLDSYTQGEVHTSIGPITPGNHVLRMEAWDSFNNFAWTEVTFSVEQEGEEGFELRDLLPYPNPFDRRTNLTFFITRDARVTLKIYTVAGRLIYSQTDIDAPYGYNWDLTWDGRDAEGDKVANGVYLYKMSATSVSGEHCEKIGRVVVMR